MLEVVAEQPGVGTLVLLQLPQADSRLTRYPVTVVDVGAPAPPAAQVAVQLFQERAAYAYQALEGEVEVYGFDERISGRFAVTLREISSDESLRYAGVFHGIPIEVLPEEQCRQVQEALEPSDTL